MEKNITFRKSNSRHDVKKKPKNPDDEEINKKSNKTPVVEIIGDSIILPHTAFHERGMSLFQIILVQLAKILLIK